MANTSGQGEHATVPPEIDRWNWGAFLLNWIWGVGNNTYVALLMFVPLVNIAMPFVLGAKGSLWAWRNKRWDSVEQFRRVQKKWAQWGLVAIVFFIASCVGLFFLVAAAIRGSDAYQLAFAQLERNEQAMAILGPPIFTGLVQGSTSWPGGEAKISFTVEGQKAKGTVYLDAFRDMGRWKANRLELVVDGRPGWIDLNQD
jgi:hypothetical protein